MQPDFDTVVVGAGVIGLAVAREAALAGKTVLVLERGPKAGLETSSRNSEVIHAGIYYPAGSLKAKLCIEGRRLLYDYCEAHGVATKKVGKLIVANSSTEEAKLQSIGDLAMANGVDDLQWLTPAEVSHLEPEIHCTKALFSPSTGTLDASGFMLALQGNAENAGASFAFNAQFGLAHVEDGMFIVKSLDTTGEASDITCRNIYNCAGHGAHAVARGVEGYQTSRLPPRFLAKGNYFSVSAKNPFRHLVYPVPVSGALGIHATLDMSGEVRFGPDISWVDDVDYSLPDGLPEKFTEAVARYWPGVRERALSPSYCGIRPKIHGPGSSFADFQIQTQSAHAIAGLVNFFGIESPGLTASLAIAKYAFHHSELGTKR